MKYVMLLALVAFPVLAQECYDTDGALIVIPENRKLVSVPKHWPVDEIYRESKRVEEVKGKPKNTDPDCLSFGAGCGD